MPEGLYVLLTFWIPFCAALVVAWAAHCVGRETRRIQARRAGVWLLIAAGQTGGRR